VYNVLWPYYPYYPLLSLFPPTAPFHNHQIVPFVCSCLSVCLFGNLAYRFTVFYQWIYKHEEKNIKTLTVSVNQSLSYTDTSFRFQGNPCHIIWKYRHDSCSNIILNNKQETWAHLCVWVNRGLPD
jgi:hypothetical protein